MIRGVRPHTSGYTIVELLIVLSVTTALISSALLVFNGRIPASQFDKALNEFELNIRSTQNEVASGFYPSLENISCSAATGVQDVPIGGSVLEQGTNEECIFLGRAVQFGTQENGCSNSSPQSKEKCELINTFTVYGNRRTGTVASTNLPETNPRLISSSVTGAAPSNYEIGFGLYIDKVRTATTAVDLGGVAFIQTFGTVTSAGQITGSNQIQLHPITGSVGLYSESNFINQTQNDLKNAPPLSDTGGIRICLRSLSVEKFAIITIGEGLDASNSKREVFTDETAWRAKC